MSEPARSVARAFEPVHVAFLGCGVITRVHSRCLRAMGHAVVRSYASRDESRAESYRRALGGAAHYGCYEDAICDPEVDAVVVAVPPRYHLEITLRALEMGKHVLVEKPAFPRLADYRTAVHARERAGRVVLVGENDHYKPLAVALRRLLADDAIGELVLCHFITVAHWPRPATDWRNDPELAGGDAFFESGIHWLHLAGSLGPTIRSIHAFQPNESSAGPLMGDSRRKSMLVAFQYDNGAAGTLYYSREIPSLLRGVRLSKLFGRKGVISFESNGAFVFVRGSGLPRVILPGFGDLRGYRAMYRNFLEAIRYGHAPQMSLERAEADHRLMDTVYETAGRAWPVERDGGEPLRGARP